nr:EOG090X090D [Ilyocryptus agilis]
MGNMPDKDSRRKTAGTVISEAPARYQTQRDWVSFVLRGESKVIVKRAGCTELRVGALFSAKNFYSLFDWTILQELAEVRQEDNAIVCDRRALGNMSGDHRTVIKGSPSQYVKLNVGGSLHYTTIGTLTKHDTMLRAMFSGRMEVLTDSEGWILIDRCGKHFGLLLNFLRDGSAPLPESPREIAELLAEAKYYCVAELVTACENALKRRERERDVEPVCRVPLVTSNREEQMLISTSTKPVVKLLINRHNNKYSYTSASDDNLLKNLELFDKLSLRFSGRVLFLKDVIGSQEICLWSFFGHGKKVAEVCCTSIVYATDKKHTKVEFPEARIYEETLNILLYEHRQAPDAELMQATSAKGAASALVATGTTSGAVSYVSDEEEEPATSNTRRVVSAGLARLRLT